MKRRWLALLALMLGAAALLILQPDKVYVIAQEQGTDADPYADSVIDYQVFGNSNTHTDPNILLGLPCEHDGEDLSLGGGWVIVDMGIGEEIVDGEGVDLTVYESERDPYCNGGGASPYEVFVSNSADGPWLSIGKGNGVFKFDLAQAGLSYARYVRVEDRSSGQPDNSSPTPGADIAGFEALNMGPPGGSLGLSPDITNFITSSQQRIQKVSNDAILVSMVGDHFLDKLSEHEVRRVVNIGMNTISLVGINWQLVGRGLNHIAIPGYNAALHASWQGWANNLAARHWYKPVYDSIYNNQEFVFEATAWAGLKYYAANASIDVAKGPIKDWLIGSLMPGQDTPIIDIMGVPAGQLGNAYWLELDREQFEILSDLSALNLTPAQEAEYRADMAARQQAHEEIEAQVSDQSALLWDSYQDALADEAKWWRFWGPLVAKYAVIGAATLMWDGPGFYAASAGFATYDFIYDAVADTRAIEHDGKMLDQSLRFLQGRVSSAYSQIALNTVGALNLIYAGTPPQIAKGNLDSVAMKSFGHYRIWPSLWWAEETAQAELSITNSSTYDTAYLTSAGYTHTGFWVGAERLLPEGQALQLSSGRNGTAIIRFKLENAGESPDSNTPVDLLVLGATETGIYSVATTTLNWNPARIGSSNHTLAKAPISFSARETANAPSLPYPILSQMTSPSTSDGHQLSVVVVNPFTMTVSATVTQTVPVPFTVMDSGGSAIVGNNLVWTEVISPGAGIEVGALFEWEVLPGTTTTIPGPELAFQDIETGEGDLYTTPEEVVIAPWRLDTSVELPVTLQSGSNIGVPVTLTNTSNSITVGGVFTASIETADGATIWSVARALKIAPGESQNISLPVQVAGGGYALFHAEVMVGSAHTTVFQEIVAIENRTFLPAVMK